jgi:uncharacterized protein
MLVALVCFDKPFSNALRMVTREAHLAYVRDSGAAVRMAGPLLSDDGTRMEGSLIILDVADLSAAKAWAEADPYARAGLFGDVLIKPWRFAIENGLPRAAEPAPPPPPPPPPPVADDGA